jgi:hypothetical protein
MHPRLRIIRLHMIGLGAIRLAAAWALPALLLSLAACSPDYPMDKKGTWSLPPGALNSNDANLRVMIANPNDLTTGASEDGSEGTEAAPPVQRLVSGHRPPLPDTSGTPLGSTGESTSASPGSAGTNGVVQ